MGLTERSFLERMELMGFTATNPIINADRIRGMKDEAGITKGFFEESYDWDNDIMEITQRLVYEMDEARISIIADHFKVDLSEIRKYIEMKSQQKQEELT